MTETYGALRLERFAPSFREAVDEVRLPLTMPRTGEIRVRNRHCGINAIFDTQIARNAIDYVPVKPPSFTGVEAIGIVDAVGEGVTGFAVGDAAVTVRFSGGYREANIGSEASFIKVPAATREWLALASTGVSALLALDRIGEVQPGETVAISAAAGGLGHLLVQLAVMRGCRVIGVCGGKAKGDFVRALGAERVIDYRSEDVGAVLSAEYPGGIDVAIDTVSGGIFDAFLDNIAVHGRLVVGGAAADLEGRPEVVTGPRIAHSIYYKGASVRGFMNGLLTPDWPAARETMFGLYADNRIAVTFDAPRYAGLTGIYDAVERLLSGQSMGKSSSTCDEESNMVNKVSQPGIREAMPLLVSNEGVWEGWYRYYDAKTGEQTDAHRSRLFCRFVGEPGAEEYYQTNHYFWDDGRTEIREFPAWYENGRIWWDNELITGWAAAMQPDDYNRSTCLNWTRQAEPGVYLYEMIQVNEDRTKRARVWQWFRDGECYQRTLIDETFVTRDWASFTDTSAPKI